MTGYLSSTVVKKFSDGVLTIQDGAATPNTITVNLESGNFSYTEKNSFTWHKDRGILDHRRAGEQEAMDVSFAAKYTALYATGTDVSIYEALTGRGNASTWTSTTAGSGDVWSVDLILKYTEPGGTAYETLTFHDFAVKSIAFEEGEEANVLTFTGDARGASNTVYPEIGGAAS